MKPITIILAEDHAMVREGLRSLLDMDRSLLLVGEASNGREAVKLAAKLQPAVLVMDIAMPMLNGFEATRQIQQVSPKTRILVLSAHSDDEYIDNMVLVGASGYLLKQSSGQMLLQAIHALARGHTFFSSSMLRHIEATQAAALGKSPRELRPLPPLTTREAEVLQLVAEGAANKQVAVELGISIKTVEKHRQQLMDKLNIHDTAGLTRHAIARGVIEN